MKPIKILISLSFLILPLSSHANTHHKSYQIERLSKSSTVKLSDVKLIKEDDKYIILGKLKKRSYNTHVQPGHIEYNLKTSDDELVERGVTNTVGNLNLRHLKNGRQFKQTLDGPLPKNGRLELIWHKN